MIDLGLLWALGLGSNDDPRPHLPRPNPANPSGFLLALPTSGTAAPLFVESSTSLAPGSWSLVAPAELSLPANPLPAGAAETITIAPSALPARYIRIRAEP